MKKIAYLLTTVFAVSCLASCGGGKEESKYKINLEISGGSAEEKDAILNAINKKAPCTNKFGQTIKALKALDDVSKINTLKEDEGDYVRLTTKQVVSGNTVNFEWEVDESSKYFKEVHASDEDNYHQIVEIKYPGWKADGVEKGEFTWHLKSATCGGASAVKPSELEYKVNIYGAEYYYKDMSIAEFNAVTPKEKQFTYGDKTYTFPSTYDIVNYENVTTKEGFKPDIAPNPENQDKGLDKQYYLLVNVPAKVFYKSPDGNWGLAADGDNIIELYTGSENNLKEVEFPNLANEYVVVSGEAGRYHGNLQISFISSIAKLDDHSKITEPTLNYKALSDSEIASWKVSVDGSTFDNQAVPGLVNSLRSVTGTIVADSLLDKDGNKVTDIDKLVNNRFTFDLKVGEEIMTVAYDYHSDKDKSTGVFNALQKALKTGGELSIKGTMRYDNSRDKDQPFGYVAGNTQKWTIVPFLKEHIA